MWQLPASGTLDVGLHHLSVSFPSLPQRREKRKARMGCGGIATDKVRVGMPDLVHRPLRLGHCLLAPDETVAVAEISYELALRSAFGNSPDGFGGQYAHARASQFGMLIPTGGSRVRRGASHCRPRLSVNRWPPVQISAHSKQKLRLSQAKCCSMIPRGHESATS